MTLEVLIPVRNPTEVFAKTIDSLVAQTDQDFSVLVSDNFSTQGGEHIEAALKQLSAHGIAARKIQPPMELGRVEHWNWLHYQSPADWLKPLFVGDWLEPDCMALVRKTIAANPACRYIWTNGYTHRPGHPDITGHNKWAGRFNPPEVMQDIVLRYAMQFGPPSATAYERETFYGMGGYRTELPIAADSYLYCTLSARCGAAGIQEKLCHMNVHNARFGALLPSKRREIYCEKRLYYSMMAYHSWTERDRFPVVGFLRLLAREVKGYLTGN